MNFIIIGITFISLMTTFALFDVINKHQYRHFHEDWVKAGKAGGFFWYPPESTLFAGSLQRSIRLLAWTFGNEPWMRTDPTIYKIAMIMRLSTFLAWGLMILLPISGSLK